MLTPKQLAREAFIERYAITTRNGTFLSRQEVLSTVRALLHKRGVPDPSKHAKRYLDDDTWLRRRYGCTAGAVARDVAEECSGLWFQDTFRQIEASQHRLKKKLDAIDAKYR